MSVHSSQLQYVLRGRERERESTLSRLPPEQRPWRDRAAPRYADEVGGRARNFTGPHRRSSENPAGVDHAGTACRHSSKSERATRIPDRVDCGKCGNPVAEILVAAFTPLAVAAPRLPARRTYEWHASAFPAVSPWPRSPSRPTVLHIGKSLLRPPLMRLPVYVRLVHNIRLRRRRMTADGQRSVIRASHPRGGRRAWSHWAGHRDTCTLDASRCGGRYSE